jgi:hypothetical protein
LPHFSGEGNAIFPRSGKLADIYRKKQVCGWHQRTIPQAFC